MSERDSPSAGGVVRGSITKQTTRLNDLETKTRETTTLSLAHRMSQKIDALDAEFRDHH